MKNQNLKDVFNGISMCLGIIFTVTTLVWCCCVDVNTVYFVSTIVIAYGVCLLSKLTTNYSIFGLPTAMLFFNLSILSIQPLNNEPFNNNALYGFAWCLLLIYSITHLWSMFKWTKSAMKNQTNKKQKALLACDASVNTALAICTLVLLVFVKISSDNLLPILLALNYPFVLTTTHMTYEPDINDIKIVVKP